MEDAELVASALPAYDVGEPLGRGAWGVVIAGHHRSLEREVAIKQLPRAFGSDPAVRARFMTEARLLARLDHPHIVPIYDFVEHDDLCLLIMERLTGGTVWSRFRNEGFTQRSACAVVLATSAALQYAHEHGVLHRDIKPENLMFSAEGVLKVTDFGIAKVVGGSATMATKAGAVLGTPAYMAPEQATGSELSAATDVYALGTVLYELLAGQLPYPAPTDPIAALYQRVHEEHRPLQEVAASVPTPIAEVVGRALQRDPEDRYASAADFGVALATAAITAWGSQWSTRSGITLRGADAIVARADAAMGSAPRTTPVDALDLPPLVAPGAEHQPAGAVADISPSQLVPLDDAALTVRPSDAETIAPEHPITPPAPQPPAPARPRRRRTQVVIGGGAVLVVAAAGLAVALSRGSGDGGSSGSGVETATGRRDCEGDPELVIPPKSIGSYQLSENQAPDFTRCWVVDALYTDEQAARTLIFTATEQKTATAAATEHGESEAGLRRIYAADAQVVTRIVGDVEYICATGRGVQASPEANPLIHCNWAKGNVVYSMVGPAIPFEDMVRLATEATAQTLGF